MEQTAIFEEKVSFSPKDMNKVIDESIDSILLKHIQKKLEGKCSTHGFVIPGSISLLSRSMGQLENGRFTGNVIYYVQVQGNVYSPYNGMIVRGNVLKKNKMGLYIIYKDSIRILVPRDLHIGNQNFESIQTGEEIEVELRKSRFQINDPFILSVGVLKSRLDAQNNGTATATATAVLQAAQEATPSQDVAEEVAEEVVEDATEGNGPTGNSESSEDLEGIAEEVEETEGGEGSEGGEEAEEAEETLEA